MRSPHHSRSFVRLSRRADLTPEGLKRTDEVAPAASITRTTGRKLDLVIIATLLAVIAAFTYAYFRTSDAGDKSIAVLPFENLSAEPANAYFADGIQDEILTRLAKISDLKVISRTSTQRYRSAPPNLLEIAKQLGVANILEGSVQREADRVRITIRALHLRRYYSPVSCTVAPEAGRGRAYRLISHIARVVSSTIDTAPFAGGMTALLARSSPAANNP